MPKGPIELDRSEGARAGLAGMIAKHAEPEADFPHTEIATGVAAGGQFTFGWTGATS